MKGLSGRFAVGLGPRGLWEGVTGSASNIFLQHPKKVSREVLLLIFVNPLKFQRVAQSVKCWFDSSGV